MCLPKRQSNVNIVRATLTPFLYMLAKWLSFCISNVNPPICSLKYIFPFLCEPYLNQVFFPSSVPLTSLFLPASPILSLYLLLVITLLSCFLLEPCFSKEQLVLTSTSPFPRTVQTTVSMLLYLH